MDATPVLVAKRLGITAQPGAQPLSDHFIDYLTAQKRESPVWDFKRTIPVARNSAFPKIVKHLLAFANSGGGYLLVGWKDTGRSYKPVGLPDDFRTDQAILQEKLNAYLEEPVELGYREFHREVDGEPRRFAALFIGPSDRVLVPTKPGWYGEDGDRRKAFEAGTVFVRRGTQSIEATAAEVEAVKRRVKDDFHVSSFLTGRADQVQETLTSNIFPVENLPPTVYRAEIRGEDPPGRLRWETPHVHRDGCTYSFMNPTETVLAGYIYPNRVEALATETWMDNDDNRRTLVWLLKEEMKQLASNLGMRSQKYRDRLYYACNLDGEPRKESWTGLMQRARRKVAKPWYSKEYGQDIGVHYAAGINFLSFGEDMFLEIWPTRVLTADGKRALKGEKVGPIIKRQMRNQYNDGVLRDVRFWIEKLSEGDDKVRTEGGLVISTHAVEVEVDRGIAHDVLAAFRAEEDAEAPEVDEQ